MKLFLLNGIAIHTEQLIHDDLDMNHLDDFEVDALTVIKNWLIGQQQFTLHTSGSTGPPKPITFSREQIKRSAHRTLKTFDLRPGDALLACLNPKFVAGMMMLVRALEGGLSLTIQSPGSISLHGLSTQQFMDFASFTPTQIERILNESPKQLSYIRKILIGGAGLHSDLEKKLKQVTAQIFHSYAMTETLTHTAIRKIEPNENSMTFHALDDVRYETDRSSCLIIHDSLLGIQGLKTNDIVELLNDTSFIWKGRLDNVVNSGGIKIQLEPTEQQIRRLFQRIKLSTPFCLVARPDPKLSQKLILLIENDSELPDANDLLNLLKDELPRYHAPKAIVVVRKIFMTANGKIDRHKNTELLNQKIK